MLTLRQLRYLDALARQKHFGRAAQECAVSQPALSMQIRELEDFLGGELIERRQGDVVLTERGLKIAERAASVLNATRDLVEFAHHSDRVLVGTLSLGVIPTLAPYILPKIIPELRRTHPELRLNLMESQTKTLASDLTRGKIDLALLALPVVGAEFEALHLFAERFFLALPAGDSLSERARATIGDVEQRNLLLLEEGHCLRDQALAYCRDGEESNNEFFATSLTTIMQMVASGYGVTLLPELAVDAELGDSRVKILRFCDPQPERQIGLLWRQTSPRKADFHALGQTIIQALAAPLRGDREPQPRPQSVVAAPGREKDRVAKRLEKSEADTPRRRGKRSLEMCENPHARVIAPRPAGYWRTTPR